VLQFFLGKDAIYESSFII